MQNQETKRCGRCKRIKFVTDFALRTRRSDGTQYYDNYCRECRCEANRRANVRAAHERNKHRIAERASIVVGDNEKYCVSCKRVLPKEKFYKSKSEPDGLNTYCKECFYEKYIRDKPKQSRGKVGVFRSPIDGRVKVYNGKPCGQKLHWNGDMLYVLRTYFPNTSSEEIGEMIGVCGRVVREKAQELGLTKSREYIHSRYSHAARLGWATRRKNQILKQSQQPSVK